MSLFLGKLTKYYKNQTPINTFLFNEQYNDPEFPKEKMFFSDNENKNKEFIESIRKNLNLNQNDSFSIKYISIKKFCKQIFEEEINCTKFKQNILGNCYLLDVISLLSNYGQLLTQIFRIDKINPQGYYEICLFIEGQWQIVIIDDYIPFLCINDDINNLRYIGCSPDKNTKCCYFLLLEKAWAKIRGSYIDSISGLSGEVFQALTGFTYLNIDHEDFNKDKNYIFDFIYNKMRNFGYLFSCSSKADLVGEKHAFSVLCTDVFKDDNNKEKINMIQLRNPWGNNRLKDGKKYNMLIMDENKEQLFNKIKKFLDNGDNGIMWVDDYNYKINFESTQCCYSMLGSNVYSFRFTNFNKDVDHNVFLDEKIYFKLELKKDSRLILSHFFNIKGPRLNLEYYNLDKKRWVKFNIELFLQKGNYLIIGKFDNIKYIKKYKDDDLFLIVNLYCLDKVVFEFIKSGTEEKNILYKELFTSKITQDLKRTKFVYKHCEDLRDKFLYHQTLIKFFQEKLGCEFTLSGLGFYLDSFKNNKVNCLIRINKNTRAKFKQIVVSQYIEPNKMPSDEIYVGTSHIEGEIIGRGEIWKIKETCDDSNYENKLNAKCIFRGEIIKNIKREKIENEYESEFKENSDKNENQIIKKISSIEIIEEDYNEGIIRIKSNLEINNNNNLKHKIKSSLHPHPLYLCISDRFLGCDYSCNICYKNFSNITPSYYCSFCDFDICEKCVSKSSEFIQNSSLENTQSIERFWTFKSSKHIHPLVFLCLKKTEENFSCDNCENVIDQKKYFYFCSLCEYHLCEECKNREKPGNSSQFITYWHPHPLNHCFPLNPLCPDNFICNHCKKKYKLIFHFYCTKCDFHLCIDCSIRYSDNFNNSDIRFEKNAYEVEHHFDIFDFQIKIKEHKHPLTKCFFGYCSDNDAHYRCHICHVKFKMMDIFYLCSLCDFKYCKKCIDRIVNKFIL